MSTFRILMMLLSVGISHAQAQQYSYSAGSDFSNSQYRVHVSIGQIFSAYQVSPLIVQEGLHSVLIDQIVLENNLIDDDQIHIYPNPFINELVVDAPIIPQGSSVVEIYSLQGILVDMHAISVPSQRMTFSHVVAGTYLLRLRIPGRVDFVQKIIKIN